MTEGYKRLFDLSGKTAVVTGALGILGRRFCAGLAEFGARVAVVDLDGACTVDYAEELERTYGTRCIGIACDVSDPDSVDRMIRTCGSRLGAVDVLLNNAATKSRDLPAFFAPFEHYDLDQWRSVMAVNLDGMFLAAQAAGRFMIRQGRGGSIIQTASIYGILGPDDRIYEGAEYLGTAINTPAVYSASKAGIVGLTAYLAARWASSGIRVNTLTPGGVESGQNEKFIAKYAARVPMRRMGRPDELVGAVVYLASDASGYVTGHNLIVDGGLHAW